MYARGRPKVSWSTSDWSSLGIGPEDGWTGWKLWSLHKGTWMGYIPRLSFIALKNSSSSSNPAPAPAFFSTSLDLLLRWSRLAEIDWLKSLGPGLGSSWFLQRRLGFGGYSYILCRNIVYWGPKPFWCILIGLETASLGIKCTQKLIDRQVVPGWDW